MAFTDNDNIPQHKVCHLAWQNTPYPPLPPTNEPSYLSYWQAHFYNVLQSKIRQSIQEFLQKNFRLILILFCVLWYASCCSICSIYEHHLQHSSDKQPVRSLANIVRRKNPGSLQKFLVCATKGENWERKDLSLKDLKNTRKWTTTSKGAWKRLKCVCTIWVTYA